jgi:RNA polymerase sigma factor (TIGR02999 family)
LSAEANEITQLLLAWGSGEEEAFDKLAPLVYAELHTLARRYMAGERPGHTLQTTALVHEAYLRLVDTSRVQWQNRAHFFAVSAQIMRRILVDCARSRNYAKRGGATHRISLDEAPPTALERGADLIALDDALTAMSAIDPRKAKVVNCGSLGG